MARFICVGCGKPFVDPEHGKRKFCSFSCWKDYCRNPSVVESRFWPHVDKTGECWAWTGGKADTGYGSFSAAGRKRVYAHRYCYELTYGPIPPGAWVLHKCDNRLCVNPKHLFLGSPQDNVTDCIAKGRNACGERAGTAKLTEAQVLEIRASYARGCANQQELATRFGVRQKTISQIVNRKRWAYLREETAP